MKVTIEYQYDPAQSPPYFARARIGAVTYAAAGTTFAAAKQGLLAKLQGAQSVVVVPSPQPIRVPDPEAVEIE